MRPKAVIVQEVREAVAGWPGFAREQGTGVRPEVVRRIQAELELHRAETSI